MGDSTDQSCIIIMQSFVVASALVAVIAAKAQYFGYPYGAHVGHVYGLKSAPCVNSVNLPVPCAGGYVHHLGKREAEAEADPALFYSAYHGVPFGSSTGPDPALLYAGYAGYPYASAYGAF